MPERILIIGAGGTGSAAARFLAREGHAVTVLEQFTPDHDRGSSYGASRIIRRVYPDRLYTMLMDAAYPLWEELERDAGEQLFLRTGGLFYGPEGDPNMADVRDALDANGVPYDLMNAEETRQRFPQFRLDPDERVVYQEDGGLLFASACVRANLKLAEKYGADLRFHSPMTAIEPKENHVGVRLANGERIEGDRLIIAAGPWMKPLLQPFVDLPLVVTRQVYCHFETKGDAASFEPDRFPIWVDFGRSFFYGFPHHPGTQGVKVAWHTPGHAANPDDVDRNIHEEDREPLRRYCAEHLPGLSPKVVFEKVCLYTNTPDEDFIIDRLPNDPRVTFISGCSGHGFKFTVLLGRTAAWMATDQSLPWDLSRFRLSRFDKGVKAGGIS